MFVSREATILHADVDAFYASVEQRDDPALRGRPVIVGAGIVLAASYEAKAFGVRTAMGGARARRLCPHAVVVSPRMSAYSEASKALFRVFEDATPLVEGLSIDEAFLDVRGMRRLAGTPEEIAIRLRARRSRTCRSADLGGRRTDEVPREGRERRREARRAHRRAAGSRARVPAPVAGRAPLGRRPDHRGKAARARLRNGRRRRATRRGGSRVDGRPRGRPPVAGARAQPRSAARARRTAARVDRLAARTRVAAEIDGGDRRRVGRARRPRDGPHAEGRSRRAHGHVASALPGLLARDTLAHASPAHCRDGD